MKKRKFTSKMMKIKNDESGMKGTSMRRITRRQHSDEGKIKKLCRYFGSAKGCQQGKRCPFSHANPNSIPMCKKLRSRWGCKWGYRCKFRHKRHAVNVQTDRRTEKFNLIFDDGEEQRKEIENQDVDESIQCIPIAKRSEDISKMIAVVNEPEVE